MSPGALRHFKEAAMATKRLSTPEPIATVDQVIGAKGAIYTTATIADCDRHVRFLTARIKRYVDSSRFANLVELLTDDRDLILEKRTELSGNVKTSS